MRLLPFLLSATLLGASGVAFSQPTSQPTPQQQAQALYKTSKEAYNAKDYAKCLKDAQEAYALDPNVEYLGFSAFCQFKLGHPKEALDIAKQFLQEAPSDHSRRPPVEKLVSDIAASTKASANEAFIAKEYEKAISLYELSYSAVPEASLKYQIAQCHLGFLHTQEAILALESFLAEAKPDDPRRGEAEKQLSKLKKEGTEKVTLADPASNPTTPPPTKERSPAALALYGAAGLSGVAGIVCVSSAFALRGQVGELLVDPNSALFKSEITSKATLSGKLANASIALFTVAAASGASGVLLSQTSKTKQTEVSVVVGTSSVVVQGRF